MPTLVPTFLIIYMWKFEQRYSYGLSALTRNEADKAQLSPPITPDGVPALVLGHVSCIYVE